MERALSQQTAPHSAGTCAAASAQRDAGLQRLDGTSSVTQVQLRPGLLRRSEVQQVIGLKSKSTLYEMMKDGRFPRPVKLSERAVAWRSEDVAAWIGSRTIVGGN